MNICYKEYVKEETEPEVPTTNNLQEITIGPLSNEKAMVFWNLSKQLNVGYSSQQILTIGPCSNGDAMKFWSKAKELEVGYSSKYVESE